MRQLVTCDCGDWTFREISVSWGLALVERYCPRCERAMLLVFNGTQHISTVPLHGRDAGSLEQALLSAGVLAKDVKAIMGIAEVMAS